MYKTKRLFVSLACGTMLATGLLVAPAHAQRTEVGNASAVVGEVTLDNNTLRRPREVRRRDRIAWGDLIETERRSQLQILLLDRSSYGIGARSSVRIDRHVYDPNGGSSTVVTFLRGALRYLSGRQDNGSDTNIRTPAGRIGIRGTALDILVGEEAEDIAEDEDSVGGMRSDDDEATLVILRGPGANTGGGLTIGLVEVEAAGVTVILSEPGQAAYIPFNGSPPIGPFRISDDGLADVQEELAPEVARANSGGGLLEALIPIAIGAAAIGILLADGDDDAPGASTADNPDQPNDPPIAGIPPRQPQSPQDDVLGTAEVPPDQSQDETAESPPSTDPKID
ncbi:FecR domain-containing protein [Aurantiacibacter sp. D1-12]|uniref:FecR domain-containing protein n=1 Tax=Aurantiacibacter sp. D1-12 TaxID=2993658 RepID=UPI00237D15AC|nr:FecR domain-containing protein [Aurantiacibacter sp. D1-12]MDE1468464.1 FecR domain-containing protein [Aurantiacibacter sp. D1-12]